MTNALTVPDSLEVDGCCPDPAAFDRLAPAPARPASALLIGSASLVHQTTGGKHRVVYDGFTQRWVASDEQPYERQLRVGQDAVPFEAGWVKAPQLLVVINEEARFQRVPSVSERAEADGRVVEVGVLDGETFKPLHLVRPGRKLEFEPAMAPAEYLLRCRAGEARCVLWAIPS